MEYIQKKDWISLPTELREELRHKFQIKRSGFVQVGNGVIISDGVDQSDLLETFTLENINKIMGWKETNISIAINKLINKNGKENKNTKEINTKESGEGTNKEDSEGTGKTEPNN
jgi:hypothetical protein